MKELTETRMDDSIKSTSWKYDARGRLIEEIKTISGSGELQDPDFLNRIGRLSLHLHKS